MPLFSLSPSCLSYIISTSENVVGGRLLRAIAINHLERRLLGKSYFGVIWQEPGGASFSACTSSIIRKILKEPSRLQVSLAQYFGARLLSICKMIVLPLYSSRRYLWWYNPQAWYRKQLCIAAYWLVLIQIYNLFSGFPLFRTPSLQMADELFFCNISPRRRQRLQIIYYFCSYNRRWA